MLKELYCLRAPHMSLLMVWLGYPASRNTPGWPLFSNNHCLCPLLTFCPNQPWLVYEYSVKSTRQGLCPFWRFSPPTNTHLWEGCGSTPVHHASICSQDILIRIRPICMKELPLCQNRSTARTQSLLWPSTIHWVFCSLSVPGIYPWYHYSYLGYFALWYRLNYREA